MNHPLQRNEPGSHASYVINRILQHNYQEDSFVFMSTINARRSWLKMHSGVTLIYISKSPNLRLLREKNKV